ncbi:5'-nucleotidase [Amphritea atlantica]|uniref:5'-nucleotidase n=1 Tax=Amphritea atlantica TaxID=355243 RepID=A0A1H9IPA1_9GAMM|nr:5'-nucleotidase [Amphritea atlantica]SEQ76581.1 5'-nucleotidase [Amphritea atlantica]
MTFALDEVLVVGISSRALFNLEHENRIYQQQDVEAYRRYQFEQENKILDKGTAFHLVEALLSLNTLSDERLVEVVVMSKNSPDTGLRVLKSIQYYGLDITRSAFTGGESLAPFLQAYSVDLLLTRHPDDAQVAIDTQDCAAALIYDPPESFQPDRDTIRIAFDADAVLFSDESEYIYKTEGLERFQENESDNEDVVLPDGPFAKLVRVLSRLNSKLGADRSPLRLSIVTARNGPAHLRVIKTLRQWGVNVDQAFFLGGMSKEPVLSALRPHIFFDDQPAHLVSAAKRVPSSQVPYRSDSLINSLPQASHSETGED